MPAVPESGSDVNRSMAWQHKFLAFNLLAYGLTQEIGGCIVDGTPTQSSLVGRAESIQEKLTLTDLLNKFGEKGWHVASQSIAADDNMQNPLKGSYLLHDPQERFEDCGCGSAPMDT